MKTFGIIILVLGAFIGGFILGSYRPISGFITSKDSIKGNAELKVRVIDSSDNPVANLEVDVANKNKPPTTDGIRKTDKDGIAVFNLKPGHYFIFFNTTNFPPYYQVPREIEVDITEEKSNVKSIILYPSK